jgi:Lrp/AsnC family transcriptional regulator for asnA, asnC and gidA
MDDLDRKIIEFLQEDGRASNARIARQVGVSEGTVRRRLRRLVQDGIIRVLAAPDLEKVGYHTKALIALQVDPGHLDDVADRLVAFPETHYVAITTGPFDVLAWVAFPSSQELGTFVRQRLGAIPHVRHSETFVSLTTKKTAAGLVK